MDAGKVAVLAPEGFVEHAVQENVYAGTAMTRRASYMYGTLLARGPQGQVGCGLGQNTSTGEIALIVPTLDIRETGESAHHRRVEIEFQMAPGTEAPAEMHFYFPRYRALCMAENATHNLHNLLTLRGALVRDPHVWSGYLTEAIHTFTDRADVVFASHHWPTWGKDRIVEFLSLQRDLYAYLHDQTLRLLNQGFTGARSPSSSRCRRVGEGVAHAWLLRLGQPQRQGGLPALHGLVRRQPGAAVAAPTGGAGHPLRRRDRRRGPRRRTRPAGLRPGYLLGGNIARSRRVRRSRPRGGVRSTPTPSNSWLTGPRTRPGATSSPVPWNCGPQLRHGGADHVGVDAVAAHPEQMFDTFAINVNGPRAWDLDLALDVTFLDADTNYRLTLRNGVLVYRKAPADEATANATVKLANKLRLLSLAAGDNDSPGLEVAGDANALPSLLAVLDRPDPDFNIVTP